MSEEAVVDKQPDTLKIELSAEDKDVLGANPSKTEKADVKEPEKTEPVKEVEKPKRDLVGDIFGLNKKPDEKVKEDVENTELTESEREEYIKLKIELETQKEKEAFAKFGEDYSDEEINVIKSTLETIISGEKYDQMKDAGWSVEERAIAVLALAEKRHSKELNEIRAKRAETVVKDVIKEDKAQESIKEVAKTERDGTAPESKAQAHKRLWKEARAGNTEALNQLILGDDLEKIKRLSGG